MYRQFNIQQFHVLPTQLYLLCVLCGSEDKQRLSPSHLVSRTVCCHAGISSPICVFTYIYCTHARTHKCTAHLYRSVSLQRNFSRTSGHIKIMYGYVNVKQDVCDVCIRERKAGCVCGTDGCICFVQCFIFIPNLHHDVSDRAVLSASVRIYNFNPVGNLT